jgi:hypothetical protein
MLRIERARRKHEKKPAGMRAPAFLPEFPTVFRQIRLHIEADPIKSRRLGCSAFGGLSENRTSEFGKHFHRYRTQLIRYVEEAA